MGFFEFLLIAVLALCLAGLATWSIYHLECIRDAKEND